LSLDYSLIALNLDVPFKLASTGLEHDHIAHLSPARYEHINAYGKFFFDIAGNSARQGLRPLR